MSSKIKAVLIGAGGWGLQHARILSQRPDVYFLAIAGRTPEKTRSRAAQFGVLAYTNITEMIEKEKPDLAFLSLPKSPANHVQPVPERPLSGKSRHELRTANNLPCAVRDVQDTRRPIIGKKS